MVVRIYVSALSWGISYHVISHVASDVSNNKMAAEHRDRLASPLTATENIKLCKYYC